MSVIRKRKGPDIDLQELYNDQFATNVDDIGPKNNEIYPNYSEGFMKFTLIILKTYETNWYNEEINEEEIKGENKHSPE